MLKNRQENIEHWCVVMAGGYGNRLWPLTNNFPKPLLKVGGKPILESIVGMFKKQGFGQLFFAVNNHSAQIKKYFGDGSRWGLQISYIHEEKMLGTAGALSLLPARPDRALLVMNCDILTRLDLSGLLSFHRAKQVTGTMCTWEYSFPFSYGIVENRGHVFLEVNEKPVKTYNINAGIYVLEPEALRLVPENTFFNMTSLFEKLVERGCRAAVFPIRDYWIDIGGRGQLAKANRDYHKYFG